jgi:hypothetical protein
MPAKKVLFIGSAAVAVMGVGILAVLGAVAQVPATEYWTVVLGAAVLGAGWMALLACIHFRPSEES